MKKMLSFLLVFSFMLASSAGQIFAAAPDGSGPWADTVVSTLQGDRKNGTDVLAARSNPASALGAAETTGTPSDSNTTEANFYSLGFGGTITLGFDNAITNGTGDDLMVYEVTGGSYPDEMIEVAASHNGTDWVTLSSGAARDEGLDLGILPCAKFVRITDVSNPALFEATADGYDLDAVTALHNGSSCAAASSLNVDKTADQTSITPGTTVNYTYTVTNTGSFALDTVAINDDRCLSVTGPTGDTNSDSILQMSETWVYMCSQVLHATTTNTATVTAHDPWDHAVQDTDTYTVTVQVAGCTYTQGYWKNHYLTSNHPDSTWSSLANYATWYGYMLVPVKGNAWYQLAHQYVAAQLNVLNDAYASPEVLAALTQAQTLLTATPFEVTGDQKATFVSLAGTLGAYNEGLTVTPHCAD
jgi:hypothetical protein